MTEAHDNKGNYKIDHSTFGGIVYLSDFNTGRRGKDSGGSVMAKRIMEDKLFDERCRKNCEYTRRK